MSGPWNSRTGEAYGTRQCPTCNGRGINPVMPTMVCPKCHGEKRIAVAPPRKREL